jgi:hypothetical protein
MLTGMDLTWFCWEVQTMTEDFVPENIRKKKQRKIPSKLSTWLCNTH